MKINPGLTADKVRKALEDALGAELLGPDVLFLTSPKLEFTLVEPIPRLLRQPIRPRRSIVGSLAGRSGTRKSSDVG